MSVTIGFSLVIYAGTMQTARNTIEMHEQRMLVRMGNRQGFIDISPQVHQALLDDSIEEIKHQTLSILLIVNTAVLVISGFLAYILSGKTLSPIEQIILKQKRFIADAAHELKTPVTAIKTGLEVTLRNKRLNLQEAKETLAETIDEVDSLTYLIHSIIKQNKYEDDFNSGKDLKSETNIH